MAWPDAYAAGVHGLPASTILLVDDTPVNLQVLVRTLQAGGHRILAATNGRAALDIAMRARPDLVLLDVMMPARSGFEVCQTVRADETLAGVRIVLLTAKGRDADVAKGLALGADAYVTKPISTRDLARRVRELLEGGS